MGEGDAPNTRHNPARLRLLRWILKDPRDYYFFPFLSIFILLLLFQSRGERTGCRAADIHTHTHTRQRNDIHSAACIHVCDEKYGAVRVLARLRERKPTTLGI